MYPCQVQRSTSEMVTVSAQLSRNIRFESFLPPGLQKLFIALHRVASVDLEYFFCLYPLSFDQNRRSNSGIVTQPQLSMFAGFVFFLPPSFGAAEKINE